MVSASCHMYNCPLSKASTGQAAQVDPHGQPSAEETQRELRELIRDTAELVEVMNQQASELERQGWNKQRKSGKRGIGAKPNN